MMKKVRKGGSSGAMQDLGIVALSVAVAVLLIKTNALGNILASTQGIKFLGSFVAGLFFTSIFTTAPAIVALGEISQGYSLLLTALAGAMGAVAGDLLIFRFVRDRFSGHLLELLRVRGGGRRVRHLFKSKSFRWLTFLIGGLIIASPLPDELGISLLGFSKMKTSVFVTLSFVFNFIGILLVGLAARAL
jgi:hypothetical protein